MKNRVKCENDLRKVGKSIFSLWKRNQCTFQKYPVDNLWEWQTKQIRRPLFTLHDGPPFANGPLHIGHFLNKVRHLHPSS